MNFSITFEAMPHERCGFVLTRHHIVIMITSTSEHKG